MVLTAVQIIGILLIISMIIIIIVYSLLNKQNFYNYKLPILGKNYDLKLSTIAYKMKNKEPSSEEPSSEEPSSEEPLTKIYINKQLNLKQKQFPVLKIVSNRRQNEPKPNNKTMRRILNDLSNSGIIN